MASRSAAVRLSFTGAWPSSPEPPRCPRFATEVSTPHFTTPVWPMRDRTVVTWPLKAPPPGSTSQRNAERRGLQVAYTRALFIREPA